MQTNSNEQISQNYRYWRKHLLISMIVGYAAFQLTRKSLNIAMPEMQVDLTLGKEDIGWIASLFYIAYGCSKFVSGVFHDHSGYRWFMGAGLIVTGILNIVFAFCSSLTALLIVWTLNGFFQGWGWPPCARLLTHWYSRNERGFWWGCWNISINISGILLALLSALLTTTYSWRVALLLPGIISIILGIWLFWRLPGIPQEHGLPSIGNWRKDVMEQKQEQLSPPMPMMKILQETILCNRTIWLLGCAYILVYFIRITIHDWGNLWLSEKYGINVVSANMILSLFELGGLLGAFFSGWGSDLFFRSQRIPMILLFSIGLFFSVTALWLAPIQHYILLSTCIFSIGFFVFGPQMLIGLAATEYCHKNAAGTVTGYLGLYAYLSAAMAGWPLSQIINYYDWSGMFALLTLAAALMGLLLMPLLMADINQYNKTPCQNSQNPHQ
ncbi:MFS transporter [Xenorhabdus sp. Reich]|uniref:MFS transporter n=1 Tax=Xenorhabdus littoralis TaxID=2582835 RepID=A0ABU4SGW8_9GAMM|nr:MFS transporter family glucose-6-phosphate receptor UhpC [Xenorhabdus sp. Reich]MDX7997834.1 MFS transporter [Xenorhabdus sp. Reich]